MKTLSNNFTSQTVYKRNGYTYQSIKLPNIRKPYTSTNISLSGVSDAQVNELFTALDNIYSGSNRNRKQEVINIMAAAPYRVRKMFIASLDKNDLFDPLYEAIEYMVDIAFKDYAIERENEAPNPRTVNTYKRLKIIDWTLHYGNCFEVLAGSVTDAKGFELTEKHINKYPIN